MNRSFLVFGALLLPMGTVLAQPVDDEDPLAQPLQPPVVTEDPPAPTTPAPTPPPSPTPAAPAPVVVHDAKTDPVLSPAMATLDRMDGKTRFGGELVYPLLKGGGGRPSTTLVRLELHGQYVTPEGFGAYATLPLNFIRTAAADMIDADNGFGLGNIELGVLYALHQVTRPDVGLVLHFGITAPSGNTFDSDPNDIVSGATANYLGAATRLTDFYQGIPRGLSVRAGVSPMWRSGRLFFRGDIGFDFNIDQEDANDVEDGFTEDAAPPIIKVNFGFGYDGGSFSVTGESTNLFVLTDLGDDPNDEPNTFNALALAARFPRGDKQPYFAISFPLDEEVADVYDLCLTVGLDMTLD